MQKRDPALLGWSFLHVILRYNLWTVCKTARIQVKWDRISFRPIRMIKLTPKRPTIWGLGLGNYFQCKRFTVQTLLLSREFVIQVNLQHDTISLKLGSKLKYLKIPDICEVRKYWPNKMHLYVIIVILHWMGTEVWNFQLRVLF